MKRDKTEAFGDRKEKEVENTTITEDRQKNNRNKRTTGR